MSHLVYITLLGETEGVTLSRLGCTQRSDKMLYVKYIVRYFNVYNKIIIHSTTTEATALRLSRLASTVYNVFCIRTHGYWYVLLRTKPHYDTDTFLFLEQTFTLNLGPMSPNSCSHIGLGLDAIRIRI